VKALLNNSNNSSITFVINQNQQQEMRDLKKLATSHTHATGRSTKETRHITVTVMGYKTSGKTSILRNIMGWKYNETYTATIGDVYKHNTFIHGCPVLFEFQEFSEEFLFSAFGRELGKNCCIILLVFSLDDEKSFRKAFKLYDKIKDLKKLPVVFVGNKTDLIRRCPMKSKIQRYVENELKESYVEMSAKTSDGLSLLKRIYEENEIVKGPYRTTEVSVKKFSLF